MGEGVGDNLGVGVGGALVGVPAIQQTWVYEEQVPGSMYSPVRQGGLRQTPPVQTAKVEEGKRTERIKRTTAE